MRKISYILLCCFLLAGALFFAGCSPKDDDEPVDPNPVEEETEKEEEEEEEEEIKAPEVLHKVPPVMAIIDNSANARPQSGLQQATLVYEFLVEGSITRFLAVFDTLPQDDFVIGPIRSLRPYFGQQAAEHGGKIAHGGYSKRTAELIRGISLKHIVSATYLWRDSSRKAPHNLYTHMEKLLKAAAHDGSYTAVTPVAPPLPVGSEDGTSIEVSYHNTNKVSYTYDADAGLYRRFINGKAHTDRVTGLQYNVRRVILRKNPHANVPDTNLVNINLKGEGQGVLFEAGQQYKIRWKYENGKTNYYYSDNTPVDLSYGNTWIQVVR